MLEFFRCLVAAKVPGLGQKDLLALLVNPVLQQQGAAIHKQVLLKDIEDTAERSGLTPFNRVARVRIPCLK